MNTNNCDETPPPKVRRLLDSVKDNNTFPESVTFEINRHSDLFGLIDRDMLIFYYNKTQN